jgi:hypothetical protein
LCIIIAMTKTIQQRAERARAKGRAHVLLNNAKYRARKTGALVTITHAWIVERIERGRCALCGLPFDLSPSPAGSAHPYAPSLDRIDNSVRDYTPENTRVVLHSINTALNQYGVGHLLMLCDAIRAHQVDETDG